MVTKDQFADHVRSVKVIDSPRPKGQRGALDDLTQERSRTLRKKSLKSLATAQDKENHESVPRLRGSPEKLARQKLHKAEKRNADDGTEYAMTLQNPLEFAPRQSSSVEHSTRPNKKGRHDSGSFERYIPENPRKFSQQSQENCSPPRPRTSRGPTDDSHESPSFTTIFPPTATTLGIKASTGVGDQHRSSSGNLMTEYTYKFNDRVDQEKSQSRWSTSSASTDTTMNGIARKSKFLEGSMNDRSQAIASTWPVGSMTKSVPARESAEDDDTTSEGNHKRPRSFSLFKDKDYTLASGREKTSRPSSYVNANTSSITNNTNRQPSENPSLIHQKSKGQNLGLRSSFSTLNFQGISEKFKIFGSSKAQAKPSNKTAIAPEKEVEAFKALMNERKRKAEAAYAEQFGYKKQRAGDDIAGTKAIHFSRPLTTIHNQSQVPATAAVQRTVSKMPESASTPSPSNPNPAPTASVCPRHASSGTLKKRPSRRDLEKENAELRALLAAELRRHRSAGNFTDVDPAAYENGDFVTLKPGKGMGVVPGKDSPEDIPPLPRLSHTRAESWSTGNNQDTEMKVGHNANEANFAERMKSRPFSTGDEVRIGSAGVVRWDWPEDCF